MLYFTLNDEAEGQFQAFSKTPRAAETLGGFLNYTAAALCSPLSFTRINSKFLQPHALVRNRVQRLQIRNFVVSLGALSVLTHAPSSVDSKACRNSTVLMGGIHRVERILASSLESTPFSMICVLMRIVVVDDE